MWAYVHAIFRHGFLYRLSPDMPASVFMTMDVCLPNKRPPAPKSPRNRKPNASEKLPPIGGWLRWVSQVSARRSQGGQSGR